MFDVGFSEIVLLAVVSLVVLGPERLPHAARLAGAWIGKARRIFFDLKHEIETEINAKELQERLDKLQQQVQQSMNTLENHLPDALHLEGEAIEKLPLQAHPHEAPHDLNKP
jgi:sec-independent protein translocase protein TatB